MSLGFPAALVDFIGLNKSKKISEVGKGYWVEAGKIGGKFSGIQGFCHL